jgi:hypothetical protein
MLSWWAGGVVRLFDARNGQPVRTLLLPAAATALGLAAWAGPASLMAMDATNPGIALILVQGRAPSLR